MRYIITHTDFDNHHNNENSRVLYVGEKYKNKNDCLNDSAGNSISNKNPYYCELTGIYWLWKNAAEKEDDYIGIEHYRRYFNSEYDCLDDEYINNVFSEYDIILPVKMELTESVEEQYKIWHVYEDLNLTKNIIKNKCISFLNDFEEVMNQHSLYTFNMMICKRALFNEYCEWLFNILFELEKEIDINKYSDPYQKRVFGFIAERLLNIWVKNRHLKVKEETVIDLDNMIAKRELKRRYVEWLGFSKNDKIYILRDGDSELVSGEMYDTIVIIGLLEKHRNPASYLKKIKKQLNPKGKLILYCHNRFGLKYFIGEPDPFTKNYGDGIENYIQRKSKIGRLYSFGELKSFIEEAGFVNPITYSIFSDIDDPKFIISENYNVNELMSIRYFPQYNNPERVFMNEEYIVDGLINNDMLPQMANGLLFVAGEESFDIDVNEVVFSDDRGYANSMMTIISKNGTVKKMPMYDEGNIRIKKLDENHKYLKESGINVVNGEIKKQKNGSMFYIMPLIHGEIANKYLKEILFSDKDKFIGEIDRFREQILSSSEVINPKGNVLKRAFLDMVPLNCFVSDGEYIFFDQEYCEENYPADAIIVRAILIIYELDMKMEQILPKSFFFERYGLNDNLDEWLKMCNSFTDDLIARDDKKTKAVENVDRNRQRLNYSEELYEKLMYNPVAGLENKDVYVYGLCKESEKFIEMYQRDFPIKAIVTSSSNELYFMNYPVVKADTLSKLEANTYRVIICSPAYEEVRLKLLKLGISDVAIYQANKVYPGRQASELFMEKQAMNKPKKYHIGYIAGVFDLYHLGHLNMFKRAKEQCDYLIVGVVTDAGVRDFKKVEPFIPFCERVEMVRSCRYVDEVVEIPYFNRGTIEAFEKYHFDVQFSGSDYENNPLWLYHKQWLNERGSEMIFLSYTAQTSSSKIKDLINKNLL